MTHVRGPVAVPAQTMWSVAVPDLPRMVPVKVVVTLATSEPSGWITTTAAPTSVPEYVPVRFPLLSWYTTVSLPAFVAIEVESTLRVPLAGLALPGGSPHGVAAAVGTSRSMTKERSGAAMTTVLLIDLVAPFAEGNPPAYIPN
jgi:hypothetical protein